MIVKTNYLYTRNISMDNKKLESYFDELMPILFPWGKESLWPIVKNICNSFSKDISFDECMWVYISFKALLYIHKIKTDNIQENVDYLIWYIWRQFNWKYNYSECYELIQCMANSDPMVLSRVCSFWMGSFEEDEIGDELGDDFWYSIDNPIKTAWIAYSNRYLDHLYKANMWKITYKRLKSVSNVNLWYSKSLVRMNHLMWYDNEPWYKCVDIYQIFDENWNYLTDLCVCPYYKSTTKKAPRWFKYTW